MHPLFSSPRIFLLALSGWLTVIAGFIFFQQSITSGVWMQIAILSAPPLFILFFILLSNYFIAKAIPISGTNFYLPIIKHGAAAILISAFWLQLSMMYSEGLVIVTNSVQWRELFAQSTGIYTVTCLLFYFISALLHYLYLESERLHQVEQALLQNRLATAKSELNALRLSVHPHFLFNSLTALTALIRTAPEKASELTLMLADFLRFSLQYAEKEWTTISDEINHISHYLNIERTRLGSRLTLDFKIDPSAKNCFIPPFSLLPLIENAIKHGFETQLERGVLKLIVRNDRHSIFVFVGNPLHHSAPRGQNSGFGLKMLRKRMEAAFDEPVIFNEQKNNTSYSLSFRLPVLSQIPSDNKRA